MREKQNHVWVVEIKEGDRWHPLHWVFDTRYEARVDSASWKDARPTQKLRVKKYIRWDGE